MSRDFKTHCATLAVHTLTIHAHVSAALREYSWLESLDSRQTEADCESGAAQRSRWGAEAGNWGAGTSGIRRRGQSVSHKDPSDEAQEQRGGWSSCRNTLLWSVSNLKEQFTQKCHYLLTPMRMESQGEVAGNVFSNHFGIPGLPETLKQVSICFSCSRRMLHRRFTVKLQKCFLD